MPDLSEDYFTNPGDLNAVKLASLVTNDMSDGLIATLTDLGWRGQLCAGIALTLSADGENVESGQFWLRGKLSAEPLSVNASKLWDMEDKNVTLSLAGLEGSDFSFHGGTLCSDYLDPESIRYSFNKNGVPIAPPDWEEYQIGDFCLRLVACLDKSSNARGSSGPQIKFWVILYPMSVQQLEELGALTQKTAWPGLLAAEGVCGFFPVVAAGVWGAPMLPVLMTHQPDEAPGRFPGSGALRFAMAAIMRTAILPSTAATRSNLAKKIKAALRSGAGLVEKAPAIVWPVVAQPGTETGRESCKNVRR